MAITYGALTLSDPVIGVLTLTGDGYAGPGDLVSLVVHPVIQQHLGLSEDQRPAAERIAEQYRAALREYYSDFKEQEPGERRAQRRRQVEAARANAEAQIWALLDAEQLSRLKQLSWRIRDGEALLDDDLAEALKLTPEQRKQLAAAKKTNEEEERELQETLRHIRFKSEEELEAFKARHQTSARQRLMSVLTPEQRHRFEQLAGGGPDRMVERGAGRRTRAG